MILNSFSIAYLDKELNERSSNLVQISQEVGTMALAAAGGASKDVRFQLDLIAALLGSLQNIPQSQIKNFIWRFHNFRL